MSVSPADVHLAAVVHIDPNHPAPGWPPLLLALVGLAGGMVLCAGLAVTVALLRVNGRKTWGNYLIGPVITLVGLAIAAFGFGSAFHLW
ncbi:hypothetical protein ACIQU6_40595 [Streptomyces sp. NPDC090442]|uniref:hypothetical protein n=1 Tax=Streptomyces sp. NPDC090442 TaxID=3365962 RepID=UPI0037FC2B93